MLTRKVSLIYGIVFLVVGVLGFVPGINQAAPADAAAPAVAPTKAAAPRLSASSRKSLEARIRRLEEMIGRLNARKAAIEAQLADPGVYQDTSKAVLQDILVDQAHVGKELIQLESEWLEKQAELEQPRR